MTLAFPLIGHDLKLPTSCVVADFAPDTLRELAFRFEDKIIGRRRGSVKIDRSTALYLRSALLKFADQLERDA